jgi:hypothetical protein
MTQDARPIEPDDVVRAAAVVTAALAPAVGRDWSVRAGRLDWDVDFTITHMLAPAKHALYLAARSTRFIAVGLDRWGDASQAERLDAVNGVAAAMANIAAQTPPDARAYHASGMTDAQGYVAMDCLDLLVHGHDVAAGLGLNFVPPDELCQAVVARLLPWLADAGPAWETMLRHTGRIGRSGDDSWTVLKAPLSEWDGAVPIREPGMVVEWVRDGSTWKPRYLDEVKRPS